VYGNGAALDASDPLDPADWVLVAPGLYKNDTLYARQKWNKDYMFRFFMKPSKGCKLRRL
jgi:hypothetical protein